MRLRTTLAVAFFGHLLVAAGLSSIRVPTAVEDVPLSFEVPVDVFEEGAAGADHEGEAVVAVAAKAARGPGVMVSHGAAAPIVAGIEGIEGTHAESAGFTFSPMATTKTTDIGVGTLWKTVVTNEAPRPAAERALRDALRDDDVARGFGRAGAVVTAAHEAASSPNAPTFGETTIDVECDGEGHVVAARAASSAWDEVAKALVLAMKDKTVRAGGKGLRATVRIVAEKSDGVGKGKSSLGAVPDDAPGSEKVCDGEGITRRCVAGMPLGFTSASHDASKSDKQLRVVHVQLVRESDR